METMLFSKRELNKYFELVTDTKNPQIKLSVDLNLGKKLYGDNFEQTFDDGFIIDVKDGKGSISATNERSVLLGVYRMYFLLGCRFFAPGKHGEIIVKKCVEEINVYEEFQPLSRHRGVTIEGSCSIENVIDMIEWMPKAGFNAYFLQFTDGYTFFQNHYDNVSNPLCSEKTYSEKKNAVHLKKLQKEVRKRGLLYHCVGHGWTCLSLGRTYHGFTEEEKKQEHPMLAEIDGKRTFFLNEPLVTQLCYSNEAVKQKLAQTIVNYAQDHSEIDVLHIWLADNYNNFCTCENCQKTTPSDDYVEILNLVDSMLTEKGIKTKLVFLIYYELLWPPKKVKINNPDRFILMFAPISRTFYKSYCEYANFDFSKIELPEYKRNKLILPSSIKENLAYLKEWQKVFGGDSFVFDYHMMWDVFRDKGILHLAEVTYNDLISLKALGLNGYVSCQVQRAFFPNALDMYVISQALFGKMSFEDAVKDYIESAYGKASETVMNSLKFIELLLPYEAIRNDRNFTKEEIALLRKDRIKITEYTQELCGYLLEVEETHRNAIEKMISYFDMVDKFVTIILLKHDKGKEVAKKAYEYYRKLYFAYEYLWNGSYDAYENNILNESFLEMPENFD